MNDRRKQDGQEKILTLAPLAVRELEKILNNEGASVYAQIQAADIVLNRTWGAPEATIRTETEGGDGAGTAASIIENIRKRKREHE